ncbi:hypothetical protein IG193_07430 [Infirmifilum lucidum]|uniref:Uncharacterized protein n=1 Tax=Infirmifilum lucidum TaxID=2776706 RepID=A0A7L9FFL6_9CREN|nr:hypothetical protein [Infirmifilum lucidum]QOJ78580.1 hypothetical protein IG193_07430 [Infirmifilum lucidum]
MYISEASLGAISRGGLSLKLNPNEWRVISAATRALTVAKISEIASLSYSTVIDVVKRLGRLNLGVSFVPHHDMLGFQHVFLLFEDYEIKQFPVFTQAVYKLLGRRRYIGVKALVPETRVPDYISAFRREPLYTLRTYEVRHWMPSGRLTKYLPGLNIVVPTMEKLGEVLAESRVPRKPRERKWVDWVDLVVLYFKMKYVYTKLSDMTNLVRENFRIEPPSRQLMSYHYRTHVVNFWSHNKINFRLNPELAPLKVYIFNGKEGESAARTLIEAPYMHEALVGESSAVILGQSPSHLERLIYEVIYLTAPEMPFGALLAVDEHEYPWLSARVIEYYRARGEYPDPEEEFFPMGS